MDLFAQFLRKMNSFMVGRTEKLEELKETPVNLLRAYFIEWQTTFLLPTLQEWLTQEEKRLKEENHVSSV